VLQDTTLDVLVDLGLGVGVIAGAREMAKVEGVTGMVVENRMREDWQLL
jgi:hypothetical protein